METLGGDMFGYWSTARLKIQMTPDIINTIDITIAVTGLLINVFAIIF
jgi:preprotein translocase subunit Sec61beta